MNVFQAVRSLSQMDRVYLMRYLNRVYSKDFSFPQFDAVGKKLFCSLSEEAQSCLTEYFMAKYRSP